MTKTEELTLWLEEYELLQYLNVREPYAVWHAIQSLCGNNYYQYDPTYPVPFVRDCLYVEGGAFNE